MKKIIFFLFFTFINNSLASSYLLSFKSKNNFDSTLKKIDEFISKKGLRLFKIIDHSKNAQKAGLNLSRNIVYLFGNPKVGTPLMKASPSIGIDLPIKIHVYMNKRNDIIVSYNKPEALAQKHGIDRGHASLKKMTKVLSALKIELQR